MYKLGNETEMGKIHWKKNEALALLFWTAWVPSPALEIKRLEDEHNNCKLTYGEITMPDELHVANTIS